LAQPLDNSRIPLAGPLEHNSRTLGPALEHASARDHRLIVASMVSQYPTHGPGPQNGLDP
jgi:hypothetical protein